METTPKKHTFGNLADQLSDQLYQVHATLQLCSFAAEARRVLTDIDDFLVLHPGIEQRFSERIEAHSEWIEHDDSLALVLKNVTRQVKAAHDLLNNPEVHRDINNP